MTFVNNLLKVILLGAFITSAQSNSHSEIKSIEQRIMERYPEQRFLGVIWPEVEREGKLYKGNPYVLESPYSTTSRVCRTRKLPLTYSPENDKWDFDVKEIEKGAIYLALVRDYPSGIKCSKKGEEISNFFITDSPIPDESIIRVFTFFENKDSVVNLLEELDSYSSIDRAIGLEKIIRHGKVYSMGVTPLGLHEKFIDYELTIADDKGVPRITLYIYFEDSKPNIRKVTLVELD